jgi:hypothetical protein
MIKKQPRKAKIYNKNKNKNSNRINVINHIKIGETKAKKKKYTKRPAKAATSGVSSIMVNVPQSLPSFTQSSQPFFIQPEPSSIALPVATTYPASIITDEVKKSENVLINEYESKPTPVKISNEEKSIITPSTKTADTPFFTAKEIPAVSTPVVSTKRNVSPVRLSEFRKSLFQTTPSYSLGKIQGISSNKRIIDVAEKSDSDREDNRIGIVRTRGRPRRTDVSPATREKMNARNEKEREKRNKLREDKNKK